MKEKVNLILTTSNKRYLIKFQVDTIKTDISYLHNKNKNIMNREYTIRKFTEKPRQDYRSSSASFNALQETINYHKTNIENTN